ncbi:MAG TPA: hypothetical protein VHL57_08090, partial [Flavobacteriales bacterium]|nr:hypothetical protein [Flavobacteriales bacterium]
VHVAAGSTAFTLLFDDPGFTCYGTNARRIQGTKAVLWAGNALPDNAAKYTGANNDRDPILVAIGGTTPTNVLHHVYRLEDVNLDGDVKYTGADNDRDPILLTVGSLVPTSVRAAQLP